MDITPDPGSELVRVAARLTDGQLRDELFRRLDIMHLSTPPLRDLYDAMVANHESFWTAVYPLFINRQIARSQVRAIVSLGLAATGGRYKAVARLFNLRAPDDYKKFLGFLDHFDCKPSFKDFRDGATRDPRRA
jgi:hypothetical protein